MTNEKDAPPDLTPGQRRVAEATAAKMRKSEKRWADHLRGRGWAVVEPGVVEGLKRSGPEHGPDDACQWCAGYWQAISDALG